jgi:perosamine synthetase
LGIAQLERIDEFVEIKRVNGARYGELLNQITGLKTQIEMPWAKMVYWMYAVELDESIGWNAEKMMAELSIRGVGTRPFFLGLHEQPALCDKGWYQDEKYPVTHKSSRQGFYLPSSLNLTNEQIEFTVEQIKDILKN